MNILTIVLAAGTTCVVLGDDTLHPWSTGTHPTDVAKSHVEEFATPASGTHKYTVFQGGTMDGRNCRSPMGCGIAREGALLQTWESNRSVRMENVGDIDIVNPWLSNGRNNFRSVEEIVSSAISPDMTDADKAFALWFQEIQYRHHSGGDNSELGDPVKVFNIYGYNTCGNDSICLATLWRKAGLKVAPARALGHCIPQAYYDGGWHFYDGDMHCVYLLRDNRTVAGEQDIVRDHDLIKRTYPKGILFLDAWWSEPEMCSMYFFEGPVTGERSGKSDTTMNMVLRPGEALVWRWGQLRPLKYHGMLHTTPTYESPIYNGLWEYRPDFSKAIWRKGAAAVENITMEPDGLAADEGTTGTILWTMRSPYVFVGGRLEVEGAGAKFFICQDGKTWRPAQDSLDKFFSTVGPACYEYQLKCQLEGTARLRRLAIINDLQMVPLALPEMVVGENVFTYSDQSAGDRKVRITHRWVERSASRPPPAPAGAISPPDGGETNGTDVVFQWAAPSDPDGDAIADRRRQSVVGVTKEEMADWNPWFPANFIAETTATSLAVLGADVGLPGANKTYYRVVAVDEQGKRSGPSDYAVAPRPVVYSRPAVTARAGAGYRYQVLANRSLGDISSRMANGQQASGYFDIEKPRFTFTRGLAWLRIDEATGVLSGAPDGPGKADVIVTVAIDRPVRRLDEAVLR